MPIASRTPEGDPFSCRVCGAVDRVEPSPLVGDAVCPRCGSYIARFLSRFDERFPSAPRPVSLDTPLAELADADSLDLVELALELEEEFGVTPTPEQLAECETVEDLIRSLTRRQDGGQSL
jgi:acyl carrier protein